MPALEVGTRRFFVEDPSHEPESAVAALSRKRVEDGAGRISRRLPEKKAPRPEAAGFARGSGKERQEIGAVRLESEKVGDDGFFPDDRERRPGEVLASRDEADHPVVAGGPRVETPVDASAIAYRAMLVDRPWRLAMSTTAALAELRGNAGGSYDPLLVEEFAQMTLARGAIAQAEQVLAGARELAILSELTPTFHSLLDLQQLLERVLGLLEKRMPGTRLAIMLEDPLTVDLVLRASAGHWSPSANRRLPKGRGVVGWVMEHAEAQVVEDIRLDARWVPTGDDTRSALIVPLLSGGRPMGVLGLLSGSIGAFGQRDLTLMQAVGAQLAAAIEVADLHERLKVAASTDGLTGIHNHRYFWDRLEEEVARAERRGTFLSVAYFDLDELKRVNDSHGHLGGDAVLRTLGHLIGGHVRQEDVPARYGGDEFAIIMPDTPRDEAEKAVARLMELLDRTRVELDGGVTVEMPRRSWGVATYPTDATNAKDLVDHADTRAYALKRAR